MLWYFDGNIRKSSMFGFKWYVMSFFSSFFTKAASIRKLTASEQPLFITLTYIL